MKRLFCIIIILPILLFGCSEKEPAQVVATTLPVYEFTTVLCEGTGISVDRLITQEISCLHDYTLQVTQTKALEGADVIIISGGGLEDFLSDAIPEDKDIINASGLHQPNESDRSEHINEHEHNHENDLHIWLSVSHAKEMCVNICNGLTEYFPQFKTTFKQNLTALLQKINELEQYGQNELSKISNRNIITFHDGFSCLADEYDLNIVKAIEEESGSEASAKELKEIIGMIEEYGIVAVFTEKNGSDSAAKIISNETGIPLYPLDMAISGHSWFDAMYHNINTLKEALQ